MNRSSERSKLFIVVAVVCMLLAPTAKSDLFNLGLDINYQKGNFGYPYLMQPAFFGPQSFGGFGGFQQFGGGFQQFGGGMIPYQGMFGGLIPGGPAMTTYHPYARATDSYSFGQIGVGAVQWDQPLPPDVRMTDMYGNTVEHTIDKEARFMHELKQAVRSNNVIPIDVAPPMPRMTMNNYYSFPQYNFNSYPRYSNYVNYPPMPNPIPPGPQPQPQPQPMPVVLPGGHGGGNLPI